VGKRIDDYAGSLKQIMNSYMSARDAELISDEVKGHLEESSSDAANQTGDQDVAEMRAIEKFGNPKSVARHLIRQSRKHNYWTIGRWLLVFTCLQTLPFVCHNSLPILTGIFASFFGAYLFVKSSRRMIRPFIAPACAFIALTVVSLLVFPIYQDKPDILIKLAMFDYYALHCLFIVGIVWCTVRSHMSVLKCVVLPGLICLFLSIVGQVALRLPVLPETNLRQVQARINDRIDSDRRYLAYRIKTPYFPDDGKYGYIAVFNNITELHHLRDGRVFKESSLALEWYKAPKNQVLSWTRDVAPGLLRQLDNEKTRISRTWENAPIEDRSSRQEIFEKLVAWKLGPGLTSFGLQYLISLVALLFVNAGYRLRTNRVKPVSQ